MSRLTSSTLRFGDLAPDFRATSIDGRSVSLVDTLERSSVILLFAPGSWSPGTRRQVSELNLAHEELETYRISLLLVVTQDLASLTKRFPADSMPFSVVADEQREISRNYGVYRAISWQGIGVTRPAVFVVDCERRIRFIYVGDDDADVPETDAILRLARTTIGVSPVAVDESAEAADFDRPLMERAILHAIAAQDHNGVETAAEIELLVAPETEASTETEPVAADPVEASGAEGEQELPPSIGMPPAEGESLSPQSGQPFPAEGGSTDQPVEQEPRVEVPDGKPLVGQPS